MEPLIRPLALLHFAASTPHAEPPEAIAAACSWLATMARGRLAFAIDTLPTPSLAPAERLALTSTPEQARDLIARLAPANPRPLLAIGPAGARPHCWHTRAGRRYALVPANATTAVVAHELGHLLFGWPDLRLPPGSGATCLMAPLAGTHPARPSAPMRVAAGWESAQPLRAGLPPHTLPEGQSYTWTDLLIERQGSMLTAFRQTGRSVTLAFARPIPPAEPCTLALASRAARQACGGASS